ncbi:hypothetical protein D3C72_1978290 [compost metagenome]
MNLQVGHPFACGIEEIAEDVADRAFARIHELLAFADIARAQNGGVTALIHGANTHHGGVGGGGGEDHVPHAGFAF